MRDIDRSDGRWKTDKWKTEFQVGNMGKMRIKKFEDNLYCKRSWKKVGWVYCVG